MCPGGVVVPVTPERNAGPCAAWLFFAMQSRSGDTSVARSSLVVLVAAGRLAAKGRGWHPRPLLPLVSTLRYGRVGHARVPCSLTLRGYPCEIEGGGRRRAGVLVTLN